MEANSPGVATNLEADLAIREIAEAKGIPDSIVRDANLVADIRDRQQQMAAEQQKKQEMLESADAASKLIPAIAGAEQQAAA
jgi:hypothetical protein